MIWTKYVSIISGISKGKAISACLLLMQETSGNPSRKFIIAVIGASSSVGSRGNILCFCRVGAFWINKINARLKARCGKLIYSCTESERTPDRFFF